MPGHALMSCEWARSDASYPLLASRSCGMTLPSMFTAKKTPVMVM